MSPDNDVYGSYGVEAGYKRYNHSCTEYDALDQTAADPFVRICPVGVKSCFYITGAFQEAGKMTSLERMTGLTNCDDVQS